MKKIFLVLLFITISSVSMFGQAASSLVRQSQLDSVKVRLNTHSILEYYTSGLIAAPYSASGVTSTQTSNAIDAAISAIGSTPTILEFPANNTWDAGGLVKTFNVNTLVRMGSNSAFQDSVVINGRFEGDNTLHFKSGANLSNVGNVKAQWFGVSKDSADNNVELQHTFNSITNGGVVEIAGTKNDTTKIGSGVMPKSYTKFTGNVVLKAIDAMDSAATMLDLSNTDNVTISGFTFDGNKANQTEIEDLRLIFSNNSQNATIENCTFINGGGFRTVHFMNYYWNGVSYDNLPDSNITIQNSKFYNDNGNAIEIRGAKNLTIKNNYFENWGVANEIYANAIGLQEQGSIAKITNNTFKSGATGQLFSIEASGLWTGVVISDNVMDGDYTGVSGYMTNSVFSNNNFINGTLGSHRNGFEIAGEGNIISGNRLSNGAIAIPSSTHTNYSPDVVTATKHTNIINNTIYASGTNSRAIQIGGDATSRTISYVNVIGNNIDISDAPGISPGGIYVGLYGAKAMVNHIKIEGNLIVGSTTSASGIRLIAQSPSSDIFISNNIIDSCYNGIELPSDASFDEVTITNNVLYSNTTAISDPTTGGTIRKVNNVLTKGASMTSSSTSGTTVNYRGGVQFTGSEYGYTLDNDNLDFGTNSFTMEYFGSANGTAVITNAGESLFFKSGAYGLYYYTNANALAFMYKDTTFTLASTALTYGGGVNHHIITVVNTADSTLKVYVDGSLNKTTTLMPRSASSANSFRIAVDTMGVAKSNERIYKIRLFNRALSVGEASTLFNNNRNDLNWLAYADKGATNTLISGYDTSKVSDTVAVTKFKNIYWTKGNADSAKIISRGNTFYNPQSTYTTYTSSSMIYMGLADSLGVYGDLTGSNLFYTGAVVEFLANTATTVQWADTSGNGLHHTFVGTPVIIPYENAFNDPLWFLLLLGILVTILIRKYR